MAPLRRRPHPFDGVRKFGFTALVLCLAPNLPPQSEGANEVEKTTYGGGEEVEGYEGEVLFISQKPTLAYAALIGGLGPSEWMPAYGSLVGPILGFSFLVVRKSFAKSHSKAFDTTVIQILWLV
uniref:Uncharacterized protein n=1 Tax=Leersia perrieri TaxID=77586 RepID=A0A0D9XQJ8_9ORYZ